MNRPKTNSSVCNEKYDWNVPEEFEILQDPLSKALTHTEDVDGPKRRETCGEAEWDMHVGGDRTRFGAVQGIQDGLHHLVDS